jgi:hypothetical protein
METEQETSSTVTGEDNTLDVMSQFMDIITTFKCKGCEFICHHQQDLMNHVKTAHLASATAVQSSAEQQTTIVDTGTDIPSTTNQTTVGTVALVCTGSMQSVLTLTNPDVIITLW